jgi:hypothetical protein
MGGNDFGIDIYDSEYLGDTYMETEVEPIQTLDMWEMIYEELTVEFTIIYEADYGRYWGLWYEIGDYH